MKKMRVLFAFIAVAVAGVSVFANGLFVTQFYRGCTVYYSLPPNAVPDCCVPIVNVDCPATTGFICTIPANEEGGFYIISKKIDGGPCIFARRSNF